MGRAAGKFSDLSIITNDNPRSEDPEKIIRDIVKGISKQKARFVSVPDRRKAIENALKTAAAGDIVLIAGKGHETAQIIGSRSIPFDDKKVAREWLRRHADPAGRHEAVRR